MSVPEPVPIPLHPTVFSARLSTRHYYHLALWTVLGAVVRFLWLGHFAPWTDECATWVFSLGRSFDTIPINQVLSLDQLLDPLALDPQRSLMDVVTRLRHDDNHPPPFFLMMHGWLHWMGTPDRPLSLFWLRAPSALMGVALIPATFGLSWFTFRSPPLAQTAAALTAISPLLLFLSRQARHYSFAQLWLLLSLVGLVGVIRAIDRGRSLSYGWIGLWVLSNGLAMASHYFSALGLGAEAMVVLGCLVQRRSQVQIHWRQWLGPLGLAALGTALVSSIWIFYWIIPTDPNSPTQWLRSSAPFAQTVDPLVRLWLWLVSMVFMLPSDFNSLPLGILVLVGCVTLYLFVHLTRTSLTVWGKACGGNSSVLQSLGLPQPNPVPAPWSLEFSAEPPATQPDDRNPGTPDIPLGLQILGGYTLATGAIVLLLTYVLGVDLTLAPRFQFPYAMTLLILVSAALVDGPQGRRWWVGGVAALSVITSVGQWGYLQNARPDLLFQAMAPAYGAPALVVTGHIHYGQVGGLMGLGWQFQSLPDSQRPQFFFTSWLNYDQSFQTMEDTVQGMQTTLNPDAAPLQVWLINSLGNRPLDLPDCVVDSAYGDRIGDYRYQLYRCNPRP